MAEIPASVASDADLLEIAELEELLRVKASEVRGPGRPPKSWNLVARSPHDLCWQR